MEGGLQAFIATIYDVVISEPDNSPFFDLLAPTLYYPHSPLHSPTYPLPTMWVSLYLYPTHARTHTVPLLYPIIGTGCLQHLMSVTGSPLFSSLTQAIHFGIGDTVVPCNMVK